MDTSEYGSFEDVAIDIPLFLEVIVAGVSCILLKFFWNDLECCRIWSLVFLGLHLFLKLFSDFEDLGKAYDKAKKVVEKEGNPRWYIRCLVELEDFVNEVGILRTLLKHC